MSKIKKALIPAAGLGTRFLPATKTIPKEMLTLVDAPIILYIIEEAVQAGIEDIVLIAGRGKHAIEDFFDTSYELEDRLAKDGKLDLLNRVIKVRNQANIVSIRQKQALGLGHAVLCGQPILGKEPFAVLLGDEVTIAKSGEKNTTTQLCESFSQTEKTTISIMEVPAEATSKYGIAEVQEQGKDFFKVNSLIEKPKSGQTKSCWALPGRYVFDNSILEILKNAKPSLNNEIQLTDSMNILCQVKGINAMTLKSERFDAGDKFGYLKANIDLALRNEELGAELKSYILQLANKLKSEV